MGLIQLLKNVEYMLYDDNIKTMNRFHGKKSMHPSELKLYISPFPPKNTKVTKNTNLYKINLLDCVLV